MQQNFRATGLDPCETVASAEAGANLQRRGRPDIAVTVYHHPVNRRPPSFRRRKLSTVVRKAITSYYTDQEQKEIEKVAKQQNVSKSSFVASAALKEARRLAH